MTNGRKAFIEKLTELAAKDEKIILLVGDVGFSFMNDFIEKFPKQFVNCGIAEQNMLGVAAGLSIQGFKPMVYTMTNFILLRPLEQLRNDICYAKANVKLFGVKGGPSYKFLGFSHNMTEGETSGILEHLPNLNHYVPETEEEVPVLMAHEYERIGPSYMQI